MSIMQTRKMKKQQAEDTIVDLIEKLVLGRFEDPDQRASAQRSINGATTDLSKRQKLLTLMERDGTQTEKDARVLGDIGRLMKTFDPYGTGFSLVKDHLTPLVEHLREYVRVGEVEKKEHGEVMTPIWLVEDMLDKLPEHVWSDPSLKWLDPCNGCGVFPSVVVSRLMAGLQAELPDQVERYRHIVENMIHVCDIQAKNCFLHMVAFDPKDLFDMNIYCGSFLDEEFDKFAKDVWGVEKFDVVIGNPPYQSESAKRNKGAGNTLWDKFCLKSTSIMQKDGFLCFVHPSGWRNVSGAASKVKKALFEKDLLYLEIHNIKDGITTFGATTRYDWYVLRNSKTENLKTEILFEDNTKEHVNVDLIDFIPNFMMGKIKALLAKAGQETARIVHSESAYEGRKPHMSKTQTGSYVFPCIKYISQKDMKMKLLWSNTQQKGHFGEKKVIFGTGAGLGGVYVDAEGEYGMCQFSCGVVGDNLQELESIKKAITSEEFRRVMEACQFTTQLYNKKVIALFRKDFWKEFIDD